MTKQLQFKTIKGRWEQDAMSITVNILYSGKNGNARKFVEEMTAEGIVDAVRAEAGNEKYEYYFPGIRKIY